MKVRRKIENKKYKTIGERWCSGNKPLFHIDYTYLKPT